jgi:hypothetical protein
MLMAVRVIFHFLLISLRTVFALASAFASNLFLAEFCCLYLADLIGCQIFYPFSALLGQLR